MHYKYKLINLKTTDPPHKNKLRYLSLFELNELIGELKIKKKL